MLVHQVTREDSMRTAKCKICTTHNLVDRKKFLWNPRRRLLFLSFVCHMRYSPTNPGERRSHTERLLNSFRLFPPLFQPSLPSRHRAPTHLSGSDSGTFIRRTLPTSRRDSYLSYLLLIILKSDVLPDIHHLDSVVKDGQTSNEFYQSGQ